MKEHPILFSAEMVRAILENRKTQTRRIIKPQPESCVDLPGKAWYQRNRHGCWEDFTHEAFIARCPYGVAWDVLWVKEGAWCYERIRVGKNGQFLWPRFQNQHIQRAWFDNSCEYTADWPRGYDPGDDGGSLNKMFMPRWASRITLEVTEVRVQRLQDITAADCICEGEPEILPANRTGRGWYMDLWNKINGAGSWDRNPWVWAISFRRITP